MRPTPILTILGRELRDILRDRRALLVALVLPLALYPVLFSLGGRLFTPPGKKTGDFQARVGVDPALADLKPHLRRVGCLVRPLPAEADRALAQFALEAHLRPETDSEGKGRTIRISYNHRLVDREQLLDLVRRALFHYNQERRLGRGVSPRLRLHPAQGSPLTTPTPRGGRLVGLVPLVLILILISGCAFAALDILPGQKERGLLETLFIQPVRSGEVVLAKYLAILLLGILAVGLNLVGMWLTMTLFDRTPFGPGTGLQLLCLSLPLAMAVAAGMVWIGTLAETFREGQNYLLPLTLTCLIPAGIGVAPAVELTPFTAAIPLTGNVLVMRQCLAGQWEPLATLVNLATTLGWGGLALWGGSRLLRREKIRSGSGAPPLDPLHPSPGPRALFYGVIILFVYLVAAPLVQRHARSGFNLVTLAVFTLVPALVLGRVLGLPWSRILPLRRPRPTAYAGAVVAALGGVLFALGYVVVQAHFLPTPGALTRAMKEFLNAMGEPGPTLLILGALVPALCEETLFRGTLLGAFRSHWSQGRALLLSALLFATFHLSVHRFMATFAVGLLFGLVLLRTRNILLSVLCHALYNGLILTLSAWIRWFPDSWAGLIAGHNPELGLAPMAAGSGPELGLARMAAGILLALGGIWLCSRPHSALPAGWGKAPEH